MRELSIKDIELLEQWWISKSQQSFLAYRQFIRPVEFKNSWFVRELCRYLQEFYDDYIAGKRPILLIQAPPQHGKSWAVTDFISWVVGKNNGIKLIFASYSEVLGIRCNTQLQRLFGTEKYNKIFPDTNISRSSITSIADKAKRNASLIEFLDNRGNATNGQFRNTTVAGQVTGESLDIGIIDDAIKGREQANNVKYNEKIWDWYCDDFGTRFADNAGLLVVATRWSTFDLLSKIQEKETNVKVVNFEAIASQDEKYRKQGEALFPELKSLEFLLKRKAVMGSSSWESLYQGKPAPPEGTLVKKSWLTNRWLELPRTDFNMIVQSWDTAQKAKDESDYASCTTWGVTEKAYYLIHVFREKLEFPELNRKVRSLYELFKPQAVLIEDKSSGTSLIQMLRSETVIPVIAINPVQDKETRLYCETPKIEAGLVILPAKAIWLEDFEDELFSFPNSPHDDQVDSLSQFLAWISERAGGVISGAEIF